VARRKNKKKNTFFFKRTGKRKTRSRELGSGVRSTFSALGVVFVLAGLVVGFFYLEFPIEIIFMKKS